MDSNSADGENRTNEREKQLDEVVASFHRSRDAGNQISAADWIARNPEFAEELEAYFRMDGLVGWMADSSLPRTPDSGTRFGPFLVHRVIGRGGMGVVYEAEELSSGRRVALKVLPSCILPDSRDALRFRLEAEIAAAFEHPNILPILSSGEYAGIPYLTTPLVDGLDLQVVVRRLRRGVESGGRFIDGPGGPRRLGGPTVEHARAVACIGLQAAEALDYAHHRQVIHRDVKPSNLLLSTGGAIFVTDFGLAQSPEGGEFSVTGDLAGTLRYLPPERLQGWSDPRSDVYSLGLTLYEILVFRPAFDAPDRSRLLKAIARYSPRPPRSLNREIPRDLERIIRKAIEREPRDRYPSAAAMAGDLRRFLNGKPVHARRVNFARRVWLWVRCKPVHAAGIALVVAAVIGLVAAAFRVEQFQRSAAEAAARESQFQTKILQIEGLRTGERHDGWSSIVMTRAVEAAGTRLDERLRDQAAASMAGIDAVGRRTFQGIGGSSATFNADGSLLLIGGAEPGATWDGRARIHDIRSNRMTNDSGRPGAGPVAFTPAGTALQLIKAEGGLELWNVTEDQREARFELPPSGTPMVFTLSPDGARAAAAIRLVDGPKIRVWDCATGAVVRDLSGEASVLAFSPGSERLAAGTMLGEVRVWSMDAGWVSIHRKATDNRIQALSFARDPYVDSKGRQGWILAVGDAGAEIAVLELPAGLIRTRCVGSPFEVHALAFSPDGTMLASGGRENARIWDAASGTLLLQIEAASKTTDIAFSGDGRRLATSNQVFGGSFTADLWTLEQDRGIAQLRGLTGRIAKVALSPDGRRIAALSHNWRIGVWDLVGRRLMGVLEAPRGEYADNAALAFRLDGRRLAVSSGRSVQLWDLDPIDLHTSWTLPPGLSDCLAFGTDSELFLCRLECADGVHAPHGNNPEEFPRVVRIRNLLGPDPLRPTASLLGYSRLNASAATPDGLTFVVNVIRNGPDRTRHAVASIRSRDGEVAWTYDQSFSRIDGFLVMDPAGSYVGSNADPHQGRPPFNLLSIADGRPGDVGPSLAVPNFPAAMGPNARIVACADDVSQPSTMLRLHTPAAEAALLRLGIDGGVIQYATAFDRAGHHLAWGQTDGLVYICDLDEVLRRLDEAGLR